MATNPTPSLSDLQTSLSSLQPQLASLSHSLTSSASQNLDETHTHLDKAANTLRDILEFLYAASSHRRNSLPASTAARDNGELQSLIAHLFAAYAVAEGVALEGTHICAAALSDISLFQESRVEPLLQDFSAAKEAALACLSAATQTVEEAQFAEDEATRALEKNRDSITATSKHLDDVQESLNAMAYQMEDFAERRRELEAKKQEAKEKRQASSSSAAVSFIAMFAPVLAPVAAAAAAFASATENELRRVNIQIEGLRRQTASLNPALIEISLKDLNAEHESLQRGVEMATAHLMAVTAEKEVLEQQLEEIEVVHGSLDKVCGEVAELQKEVAETAARVREEVGRAGRAKAVCVQTIVTMARMGYEEARRLVRGSIGEILEDVPDVELKELLERSRADDDEGFESGGEMAKEEEEEEQSDGERNENDDSVEIDLGDVVEVEGSDNIDLGNAAEVEGSVNFDPSHTTKVEGSANIDPDHAAEVEHDSRPDESDTDSVAPLLKDERKDERKGSIDSEATHEEEFRTPISHQNATFPEITKTNIPFEQHQISKIPDVTEKICVSTIEVREVALVEVAA
ncbi:hypothetical protein BDD12DRAFT_875825 [Trichophaea hybrida]|nr:hypothetical protein BDD12DRAFT_875825 [Trichophaea hybrida]